MNEEYGGIICLFLAAFSVIKNKKSRGMSKNEKYIIGKYSIIIKSESIKLILAFYFLSKYINENVIVPCQ